MLREAQIVSRIETLGLGACQDVPWWIEYMEGMYCIYWIINLYRSAQIICTFIKKQEGSWTEVTLSIFLSFVPGTLVKHCGTFILTAAPTVIAFHEGLIKNSSCYELLDKLQSFWGCALGINLRWYSRWFQPRWKMYTIYMILGIRWYRILDTLLSHNESLYPHQKVASSKCLKPPTPAGWDKPAFSSTFSKSGCFSMSSPIL